MLTTLKSENYESWKWKRKKRMKWRDYNKHLKLTTVVKYGNVVNGSLLFSTAHKVSEMFRSEYPLENLKTSFLTFIFFAS